MARHAKIEEESVDAITLQKKLAAIKDPKRTFRSERSIEFSDITELYAELAADYIGVLRKLNELHSLTQVRFVVLNGAQGVGKSWCIKSILHEELGPRESTNEPIFMRYNPHDNPNSKVFLVDMPGDDSLSQDLLKQLVEFFGVTSIGIQLFKFDTRPPQLDFFKVQNAFSGSDRVLVCLIQVLFVGADGPLAEYVDAWRCYLKNNGIDVSSAESKYHLMATDLAGSNSVLRKRDAYDSDEVFDGYEGYTRRFAHSQRLGINRVRANGGHSRDDVVAWIDDAIAATGL
ncbi:hypothetical protein SPRG_10543 [Saprolegnia parasitica CBS 223.65]|uniref:Uncharacterized protein n=1 Tax=Saprolegnia parasitica (strain CBS 223.65) TaxID=695850 RepID=A0A067CB68_SAPPC|nr:hypothetical protein SPRG_10543 [Saprolegnia parasitica CBS 223.65]KDO23766.1 hypothetical protein SPRG_10543 [Saprolegnia parasitica CBS 223.65]|eukprot:XP_012205581.1 hypothetical protein SPRG_10543 [Saprolegnia parasitica CBS 223.65]